MKIIVITIIIIMLILFSLLLRKYNRQINEVFKTEDNKASVKTTTSKTDILEDNDVEGESGSE
ncbi:hypothetical protein [Priestia megaterium]|uniref:hypothetical protein n=1 Tax=Priestia megaterium TaxID=1404 RepID=UPI000BF7A214|nr:hypothetical protein [Priestia megaterium]MDH3177903.1 hypothetical protein [Priestia megaterium]PFK66602.1 hypothetical protein COJ21_24485 [Priestia megaterium]RFB20916.1 hypothetical protein DZB87_26005 [Bacillus sp. ALD]